MNRNSVRTLPLITYAAPAFLSALVHAPAASIVPTLYSTDFGISLALIGTGLLVSRSADVVLDPLIGYLSDRTGGRLGARKPWVLVGVVLTVISAWFLMVPPAHPTFAYFLTWYTLMYIAWSLMEIPHTAWGFELTRDYAERSRVITFRGFAQGLAALAFLALPLLPMFATTAVTPQTIRVLGWAILALAPVALIATLCAPEGAPVAREDHYSLRDLVSIVRGNKPLWLFLAGYILNGFAAGMFGALTFLYFANYLGLGKQFVALFGVLAVIQLASLPLAPSVISRLGKRVAWAGSMCLGMCVFPFILLVPKGQAGFLPLLLICIPIGVTNTLTVVAATSVMGDIIDYDSWRTGKKRAAAYSALLAFIVKLNAIPGGAIALMIVGLFGYQPKLGAANSEHAVLGLKLAYVIAPIIFFGLSILFAARFPIDRRRQGIIARRLEQREARQEALLLASTGG